MNILCVIIILIFTLAGIVMVISGLPGTFVTWGGIFVCSLITGFEKVNIKLLVVFLLIMVLGEVMEYLSSIIAGRRYGASSKGIIGAILGGMAGGMLLSIFLPGPGTVAGFLLGSFLGAFLGEYTSGKDIASSSRAGWGVFLGRVAAIGFKAMIVLGVSAIAVLKYFNTF